MKALKQTLTGNRIEQIYVHDIPHLSARFPELRTYANVVQRSKHGTRRHNLRYTTFVTNEEVVMMNIVRKAGLSSRVSQSFMRAGPRARVCFRPQEIRAAIVTCGGLASGLNDVIAELFNCLYYNYGADTIYGIKSGYRGFYMPAYRPWVQLTPDIIHGIQNDGGTVLGTSRGGFDLARICNALEVHGINQLYVIGGDGTHRAAQKLQEECARRGLKITIAGVPKVNC
jgi:6-phosphofructokinase 1